MAVGETPWAWMCGLAPAAVLTFACVDAAVAQAPPIPPRTPPALEASRQRDQRDRELEAVRSEQRKAAETEQKLTVESDSLSEDRRRLNQSLIETAARVRAGEERTAAAEIRLRELDGREAEIRKSLEGRRAVIAEVLAALQRIGHRPPPAVFAGAEDAIESVRAAMSLGAVLPQMRSEAERLKGELSELTRVKKEEADERSALAVRLADLAEAQRGMAALIEERQKRQSEIEQAIASERQRTLALSRQADSLKELIGKLEQGGDAAARSARTAARSAEEEAHGSAGGLPAQRDSGRLGPAVAFISAKGRLPLPVIGARIRGFGAPDGAGGSEKGISIATRPGAQVTAPSDAWVVYAAPYRSYGQLLILNVGGGYHVLLAGVERITVDLGQFVLAGEPVAVMGSGTQVASNPTVGSAAIGTPSPVLYVEFRKDGTPIDSSPWWAATENEKVRG